MVVAKQDEALFPVDDPLFNELISEGVVRSYGKKAILISEGDDGNSVYLVLSGRLKIFTSDESGKELVLAFCGPGDIVGEMALDGSKRCATVMTTEPTRCGVITHSRFRERIKHDPDLAMRVITRLIRRSRMATKAAKDLALASVYSRVVNLLNDLAVPATGGARVVQEKLSQQDIAHRVGSSRDMVNKVFKELLQGGYIEVNNREIALLKTPPAHW